MKNKKETTFGAVDAENMIDATYNKNDYPIIEKTQNAYVMPLDMVKGEDEIDPLIETTSTNNKSKKQQKR